MKLTKQLINELDQWLDNYWKTYIKGDLKTWSQFLSDDYYNIGGTEEEIWHNKQEVLDYTKKILDQLKNKVELRNRSIDVITYEKHVMVNEFTDMYVLNNNNWEFYGPFRLSSFIEQTENGWLVLHQHGSFPDMKAAEGEAFGLDVLKAENERLQKAVSERTHQLEHKNRELEIEGALERIRAQAVAMKASSDLLDIVVTMRNEFIQLGHEAHYFWHMMWLQETYEKAMTSGDGSKIGFVMTLPRHIHGDVPLLAKWEKSKKSTVVYAMTTEESIDYVDKMVELGDFKNIDPQAPSHDDLKHIGGLTFIMARTTHGEIGYSLPGIVKNPPKEDLEILVRFAGVFDLAHKRFLDLQKAEKQARETQIELALEKVRSRTMAMQHSDELQETSFLLDQQVRALGIETWGCAFNIYGEKESTEWFGNEKGVLPTYTVPHKGIFKDYYNKGKKGESLYIKEFSGKACVAHYEYMSTLPVIGDVLLKLKETNDGFPTYQIDHVVYFKYGYLLFITKEHVPDSHDVFKRFAKVFEQTYTRFLDLQKAEAQAKEAQIEAALERVRSKSIAMHDSNELKEVIQVIYDQFIHLGINVEHAGFIIDYKENDDMHIWLADKNAIFPKIVLPYFDCAHWNSFNNAKKKGLNFFANQLDFEEKNKFYKDLFEFIPDLPEETKATYFSFDGLAISTMLSDNVGLYIENYAGIPFSEAENKILMRFGKVFQQTYTRFRDLQKAEAQAREAQIETALERVRSHSMGMQSTNDFGAVTTEMFNQLRNLGEDLFATGIVFCDKHEGHVEQWHSIPNGGMLSPIIVPIDLDYIHQYRYDQWKKGEELFSIEIPSDFIEQHFEDIFNLPSAQVALKDLESRNAPMPAAPPWEIDYGASFKNGYILASSLQHFENIDILSRFAKVFEQAYTRFLDLQKAEAQIREAEIEAALERLRSASMAMHKTEDLFEVVMVYFEQLKKLNIEFVQSWITIFHVEEGYVDVWFSPLEGVYEDPKHFKMQSELFEDTTIKSWKDGLPFSYIHLTSKEEVNQFMKVCDDVTASNYFMTIQNKLKLNQFEFVDANNKYGCISKSNVVKATKEEEEILQRFSKVFEQTYTRFLDLQKAEEQAREAQIETALERVRSRAMAIRSSIELDQVIQTIFKELKNLEINLTECSIVAYDTNQKDLIFWSAGPLGSAQPSSVKLQYIDHPLLENLFKDFKNGIKYRSGVLSGKLLKTWWQRVFTETDFRHAPKEFIDSWKKVKSLCYSQFAMTHGYLEFLGESPLPEDKVEILKRFTNVVDLTYTRYDDVVKAEAQTREAQINLAVERVRAKALAMHKSEEIMEVVAKLKEEVMALDIPDVIAATIFLSEEEDKVRMWDLSTLEKENDIDGYQIPFDITFKLKKKDPNLYVKRVWDNPENYFLEVQDAKDLKRIVEWLRENNLEDIANEVEQHTKTSNLERLHHAVKKLNNGKLVIDLLNAPSDEMETILTKMGAAFDLAYKRFEDLQKAEAQTREAKIEAALEKVRSRTMAMQKGEEVKDVVVLLYKELIALGVTNFATCGYVEINEKTNLQSTWVTSPGGDSLGLFYLPLTGDVYFDARYEAWKNQQPVFHQTVTGKERRKHLEYAITTFNSKEAEEMVLNQFPDPTVFYCFNFSHGYLHLVSGSQLNEEEETLLARFTRVFEQTYARFLDLQKAEAQAREAQIENALEKVRSRSLAMHKPEELQEVVAVVAEKLKELGVIFDAGGVILCTYFPDNKDVVHWIAVDDFSSSGRYFVPYFDNPIFNDAWDSKIKGDTYFSKEFTVEAKNDFFQQAFENSDYKKMPEDYKQFVLQADSHNLSAAWSKNSAIIIPSLTGDVPSENDADIMKRFANVFEQAYIRFLDLQKAEALAREAQIETALEKVRSRTMAMQHSDELPKAANNLFLQVQELGIPAWSAGYCIWEDKTKKSTWCNMSSEGEIQKGFSLPTVGEGYNFEKPLKNGEAFHVEELGGKALVKHYDFMKTLPIIGEILSDFDAKGIELPTFQIFHIVFFEHGYVMFITYEAVPEAHGIFKRFGQVFEQTYTRFLDLKKAEAQSDLIRKEKERLEVVLSDLKATQSQLIQAEKMASLGELTAGIAHEIQNPLNFVNNFSDVSKELLEEMQEEIENGDLEEAKAIMDDVVQNLDKINHHGQRADSIVKGMLQHSRASGDKKEPTDINALAEEYLRLAYHGLRAKDQSFNAELVTDFDDSMQNINIIPQDVGRVILNLLTNAFYVVNEKKKTGIEGYKPTVSISTKRIKDFVEISVEDNGNGMPESVKEKIFQPFFTTKPTGEGTGLGLSLSYDIITKGHGGKLMVKSDQGKGTIFKIELPL
ncbi:ATP-binding protein [Winogradskyella vincentii]|uniref:histidine kinase n=1 Tax=Winogradskyella vincentii TaxID=2877122 RepID=A0ABS7XVG5_9FLAO|nr:ATP-binding protein [Winogradskyella vincentii]MCA0151638.1 nuclear transport factor 2 family protein [Winogradskyella vincentii]